MYNSKPNRQYVSQQYLPSNTGKQSSQQNNQQQGTPVYKTHSRCSTYSTKGHKVFLNVMYKNQMKQVSNV